jgi:hypothetical protein
MEQKSELNNIIIGLLLFVLIVKSLFVCVSVKREDARIHSRFNNKSFSVVSYVVSFALSVCI